MKKTFKVRYKLGHTIEATYELDKDLYCMNCGHKGLWVDTDEGDYYMGSGMICIECDSKMYSAGCPFSLSEDDFTGQQVLKELKNS